MSPAGPGRPPIGPRIEVRLPTDLLDLLDRYVALHETTRADAIRTAIERLTQETPVTTVTVLDPNHDDGTTVAVDLTDPPAWLDIEALHAEAARAGDTTMLQAIEAARAGE